MSRGRELALAPGVKPWSDFNPQEKGSSSARIWPWHMAALILGVSSVVLAIFYVWLYIQQVQNGYRLAKICADNEVNASVQRKLKLEWSRFRDPYRLEVIGRNQFGLAPPRPDQKVLMR